MQEVYFVLGMVAVLLVLGILIVFVVKNKIELLEEEFQLLERSLQDVANDLHRRLDDEVRELQFHNNETLLRIEKELSELQLQINKPRRGVKN